MSQSPLLTLKIEFTLLFAALLCVLSGVFFFLKPSQAWDLTGKVLKGKQAYI